MHIAHFFTVISCTGSDKVCQGSVVNVIDTHLGDLDLIPAQTGCWNQINYCLIDRAGKMFSTENVFV